MVKLSGFKKFIETSYTDKFSIYRVGQTQNADGTTSASKSPVPVLEDVPCRVSFSNNDSSNNLTEDRNPINRQIKIFCDKTIDVHKGDTIEASKLDDDGTLLQTYKGLANLPSSFVTHQEILLVEEGDA